MFEVHKRDSCNWLVFYFVRTYSYQYQFINANNQANIPITIHTLVLLKQLKLHNRISWQKLFIPKAIINEKHNYTFMITNVLHVQRFGRSTKIIN
jgi:hypothetical protein